MNAVSTCDHRASFGVHLVGDVERLRTNLARRKRRNRNEDDDSLEHINLHEAIYAEPMLLAHPLSTLSAMMAFALDLTGVTTAEGLERASKRHWPSAGKQTTGH